MFWEEILLGMGLVLVGIGVVGAIILFYDWADRRRKG